MHPDWHVLRARLQAARQTWQAFSGVNRTGTSRRFGSFHRACALRLAWLDQASRSVNQDNSGNRNRGGDIYGAVAGVSVSGGRE